MADSNNTETRHILIPTALGGVGFTVRCMSPGVRVPPALLVRPFDDRRDVDRALRSFCRDEGSEFRAFTAVEGVGGGYLVRSTDGSFPPSSCSGTYDRASTARAAIDVWARKQDESRDTAEKSSGKEHREDPPTTRKRGIGNRMAELLSSGKTTEEVLTTVRAEFPGTRATSRDVSIIRARNPRDRD